MPARGSRCTELSLARLVSFDLLERLVLCATALIDSRETVLGVGAIELERPAEPTLVVVDAHQTDGLAELLSDALVAPRHGDTLSGMTATASATDQLESFNPATGARLGAVTVTAPDDVAAVVAGVAQVQPFWAQLTLRDRARYLERAGQVLIDESDEIRDLIVAEQGKPRNEAFAMEVLPTIDALHWIAGEGRRILADEPVPMPQLFLKTKQTAFTYEPLGVIGVISPWNYPWSIPFGEVALALMAGNGVVLKPASLTPLIGERIARVFERAGVPEGLIRVVHGPGTGAAVVSSDVAKVFFTGSVETGRGVGEECARRLKGSVLELGGKDPMIVLGDANLEHAVAGALWGGFANAGQTCSGIERVYVMREVADRFTDRRRGGRAGAAGGRSDGLGHGDRADGVPRAVRDRARARR